MITYYCNACGFEFNANEADIYEHNDKVIICPMCGAERWDDDDCTIVKLDVEDKEMYIND